MKELDLSRIANDLEDRFGLEPFTTKKAREYVLKNKSYDRCKRILRELMLKSYVVQEPSKGREVVYRISTGEDYEATPNPTPDNVQENQSNLKNLVDRLVHVHLELEKLAREASDLRSMIAKFDTPSL